MRLAQWCLCIVDFFREAISSFVSYFAVALNIMVYASACVCQDMKHPGSLESSKEM